MTLGAIDYTRPEREMIDAVVLVVAPLDEKARIATLLDCRSHYVAALRGSTALDDDGIEAQWHGFLAGICQRLAALEGVSEGHA